MIKLPITGFQRRKWFLHDLSGFLLYYTRPDMCTICNKFEYSKLNSYSKALVAMHFPEPDLIPRSIQFLASPTNTAVDRAMHL